MCLVAGLVLSPLAELRGGERRDEMQGRETDIEYLLTSRDRKLF